MQVEIRVNFIGTQEIPLDITIKDVLNIFVGSSAEDAYDVNPSDEGKIIDLEDRLRNAVVDWVEVHAF